MIFNQLKTIKYGWALLLVDFILPIPLTILMVYLWFLRTSSWSLTLYILLLPLLFGYSMPGIGTNLLHMWEFTWKIFRIGKYYLHHGFMYAPYFAMALYATMGNHADFSWQHVCSVMISNAAVQCFLTTWHDYWAVQAGLIIIHNKPAKEGKSPAEIIMDYGPIGYALFGATYAAACILASAAFMQKDLSLGNFLIQIVAGLLIMALSCIHYVIRERRLRL